MPVAEIFIGAFVTVLFEKLASGELIKLAQSAGIDSELNKWSDTLKQIKAVLVDAAQKQIKDTSVQLWLNKLQHLAYEIDDVLDDLTTEAMRRKLNQESHASTSKVFKSINIPAKFHALKYGHKMSSNLDKITTKLRLLVDEKNLLGLTDNVQSSARPTRRFEETSLVDESKVVGRVSDKEALLGKLLEKEIGGQNVSIVSIIGLGGMGKTTLAGVLYNNNKVKDHFKLMSWVCVSDAFDVFNISKAIFKDVGGDDRIFDTLNQLQVALSDKLSNKRFLVVLDDVWNEDDKQWELLQRPFTVGAAGSKIIVTTRKTTVASVMDSVQTYPSVQTYLLEDLSDEEALSLFALNALGKQNFDSNPTLKVYGEGIILKCGKLPLALITLGRLLRTKTSDEEWEDLLNSEVWNLHNEGKILPALRLSYDDLQPHLKQMFAYCCLFPKDHMFNKHELVLLWAAEGFLYESKSMEKLGRECFEDLVSRSFFQQSANDKSKYSMHDLIHDLATNVAGEFFALIDKMDAYDKNAALEKFHHLSFIREEFGAYKQFKVLQRARRLRTFLPMSVTRLEGSDRFYLSSKVLLELLPQLQFLRVLSLAHYNIKEVPQSICSLKHLRYLNFSNTEITCLPEQVGDLYNLQSLLLSGCRQLSSLPNSIVNLVNLRHLDLSNTPQLKKFPLGFGGLTGLQTLSKVIIGGSGEFKISNLQRLVHLEGQISIKDLHKVTNGVHANEAMLQQKKRLCDLEMVWSRVFDDSRNEITEYEVLEGLRPFEKLRSLKILGYMGTKFPSWVGDSSFDCLTRLTLRGCGHCTCLPTLGRLPSLEGLFVEGMNGLKTLGLEFLRPPNSCAFPSLKILEFRNMASWEEWSTSNGDIDRTTGSFKCLQEITIINCPKLVVVTIELLSSLRILHIEGCSVEVLKSMVGSSSSLSRLTIWKIKGLAQLNGEVLDHLQAVEYLGITKCDEVTYLWESEIEACNILENLKRLEVRACVNLVSLGEKKMDLAIIKETFREVEISDCPKLVRYKCPISTEKLEIRKCDSVTSLTFSAMHDLPPALKSLTIGSCGNLEVDWLLNNLLSSLESLDIYNLPNLRIFPEGCLLHLTSLTIVYCDNIETIPENGYGFLPLHCLRHLEIRQCENLKSIPHEHLQSLTSMEDMTIDECPSMDYSFPCGLWPPNLSSLEIGGLKKPISEWGNQNFPNSLVQLTLYCSNSGVVTFANAGDMETTSSFLLPSSLNYLHLGFFNELKSVSKGLQHLTRLKKLGIYECRKLIDLPETLLPSLSQLLVESCSPKLYKKCSRKGKLWPTISQIPDLHVVK